jgi:hypothetical protein
MTHFIHYNNNTSGTGNPSSALGYWRGLQSIWRDGQHVKFGGDGYNNTTGIDARFIFPNGTDPCFWGTDEVNPDYTSPAGTSFWNEYDELNTPNDRWGLGSTGPFSFEPGSEENIYLAYVYSRSFENDASLGALSGRIDSIRTAFNNNEGPNGNEIYGIKENPGNENEGGLIANVYPNPANDYLHIVLKEKEKNMQYSIINMMGQKMQTGWLKAEINEICISHLPKGLYILQIENKNGFSNKKFMKQ